MIDYNVTATERHMAEEAHIGPMEETVLGAIETMDVAHLEYGNAKSRLAALYEQLLAHWLPVGAVIDADRRPQAPCLSSLHVGSGNSRGARRFVINTPPRVTLYADGDPELATWVCEATPLSPVTGKPMSPATANGHDKQLRISGNVFASHPDMTAEQARDAFIAWVAETEQAMKVDTESTGTTDVHASHQRGSARDQAV